MNVYEINKYFGLKNKRRYVNLFKLAWLSNKLCLFGKYGKLNKEFEQEKYYHTEEHLINS